MVAVAALAVLTVIIAVLVLIVAALVELYRDLEHLRSLIGLADEPMRLSLGDATDARPSEYGMDPRLAEAPRALVLFLADICGTCSAILDELAPIPPAGVHVYVASASEDSAAAWLRDHGLAPGQGTVTYDRDNRVSRSLGIDTTPAAIQVVNGRLSSASTVPSVRWLRRDLALLGRVEEHGQQENAHDGHEASGSSPGVRKQ